MSPKSCSLRTNASGSGLPPGIGHPLVPQPVHHVDRLAGLVRSLGVAGPAGHDRSRRVTSPPLARFCWITGTSHLGIRSEPKAASRARVLRMAGLAKRRSSVWMYSSRSTPGTSGSVGLSLHVAEQELGEDGVGRYLVRVPVARQVPGVGHGLMAGVQQAQLHQLIRHDVVDQLHAAPRADGRGKRPAAPTG